MIWLYAGGLAAILAIAALTFAYNRGYQRALRQVARSVAVPAPRAPLPLPAAARDHQEARPLALVPLSRSRRVRHGRRD